MAEIEKLKLAICNGATCSGCDMAVLDIHEQILRILEKVDIVFAPTIMDTKYDDIEAMEDKEIDVCFYHGSIRNSENEQIAYLMRQKSKILIAFGACACFGGIFGLANTSNKDGIFKEVYKDIASTNNLEFVIPQQTYVDKKGHKLTLPAFYEDVYALDDRVDVDYYIPLCPPVADQIMGIITSIIKGSLPPKGTIIASEKTLCSECERTKSNERKIGRVYRPHEIEIDEERCMLDQGLLCMGPVTRAGCGTICIKANVPCRGCNGPTKGVVDQGGNILTLIATIFAVDEERLTEEDLDRIFEQIKDPLGTFYRFTLSKSILRRVRIPQDEQKSSQG